jgi:hypothetical protein
VISCWGLIPIGWAAIALGGHHMPRRTRPILEPPDANFPVAA